MNRRDFAARIVNALNLLHTLDSNIMEELLNWRYQCSNELSDKLSEHNDFLVYYNQREDQWQIGIMGILNSFLCLAAGGELVEIVAIFHDDGGSRSLVRFEYHILPPD